MCPYSRLSVYHQVTGRSEESLEYKTRTLAIATRNYREGHARLAPILHGIGVTLINLGNYREAASNLRQSIDIWRRASGSTAAQLPLALCSLAQTTGKLGDFPEAHWLFTELVALQVEQSGENHDTVAYWLNGHGDMLANIGATALADQAIQRTMTIYEAIEKIKIVLEGLRGESSIAELCRKEGINQNLYYRWSKEFLEADKKRLAGDAAREASSDEVKELRNEAAQLKEALAETLLENR
jgi:transposase